MHEVFLQMEWKISLIRDLTKMQIFKNLNDLD